MLLLKISLSPLCEKKEKKKSRRERGSGRNGERALFLAVKEEKDSSETLFSGGAWESETGWWRTRELGEGDKESSSLIIR